MNKIEIVGLAVGAFATAAYVLVGAKGFRLARYVVAALLIAMGCLGLIVVNRTRIISDPVIWRDSSFPR